MADDADLPEKLANLRAFHRFQVTVVRSGTDYTARQVAALLTVAKCPDFGVKELAEHLGVSKPAVTRALDTLSIAGLVRRRRCEDDGRLVKLSVTLKGREQMNVWGDMFAAAFRPEGVVAGTSPDESPSVV